MRTFKERYTWTRVAKEDSELALQKFLISYRNTPQKSTSHAPAYLLLGRKLQTRFDLLKPDTAHEIDHSVKQPED